MASSVLWKEIIWEMESDSLRLSVIGDKDLQTGTLYLSSRSFFFTSLSLCHLDLRDVETYTDTHKMLHQAYSSANNWWLSVSSASPLCSRNTSSRSFRTRSSCCSPQLKLLSCSPAMTSMFLMKRRSSKLWWCGWGMMSRIDNRTSGCFLPTSAYPYFLHRWDSRSGL